MSYRLRLFFIISLLLSTIFVFDKVSAKDYYSYNDVKSATSPVIFRFSLSSSAPVIDLPSFHSQGYKGSETYVAVIDTGVQSDHPFFQNRVAVEACFSSRCPNGTTQMIGPGAASPIHWHGTHVAGIAAGSSSTMTGVAPEAKIIAINVFDSMGRAFDADIIKALNWLSSVSNQYNIASVNMSLGGDMLFPGTCDNYIPKLTDAIRLLREKNIATVVSAGNDYAKGMSSPACISYAVSVSATYLNQNVTDFSNISNTTTLAAPGYSINSSKTGSSYGTASGTSMSSPFVAGAFAAYRSKFGIVSVSSVVNAFRSTSKKACDTYANICIPFLNFTHLLSYTPPPDTTTTTSTFTTTTTTIPIVTTTTTTSVVPTTSYPSTTLPTPSLPPSVSTTIPIYGGSVPPPLVDILDASYVTSLRIFYRDPRGYYSQVSKYALACSDGNVYIFPKSSRSGWNAYVLKVSPKLFYSCSLASVDNQGKISYFTNQIRVTPSHLAGQKPSSNTVKIKTSVLIKKKTNKRK